MNAKANNGEVVKKSDGTPVKPYNIKDEKEKILRRYERFLRVRTEMDSGDVLQYYLTASNGYDPHPTTSACARWRILRSTTSSSR